MRKLLALTLTVVFILFMGGCSGQTPENTVDNYFKAVKNFDVKTMNSLIANSGGDNFNEIIEEEGEMVTYFINYIKDNAKEIEYEIINTETEDDSAKVTVKTKFIDSTPLVQATFSEFFKRALAEAFSGNELSDEEMETLMVEIMEEKSQAIESEITANGITINLVKKEDNWYLEKVSDELLNVITSNYVKAFEEISESMNGL